MCIRDRHTKPAANPQKTWQNANAALPIVYLFLDVYKRQALRYSSIYKFYMKCPVRILESPVTCLLYTSFLAAKKLRAPIILDVAAVHGIYECADIADVYKRQIQMITDDLIEFRCQFLPCF